MNVVPLAAKIPTAGFRADINGLRAWAVIAVVLFHFQIPGFTGGYVGVDVFFVISGFLMSQIIVSGLETDSFDVFRFYMARARRILPALAALCFVMVIAGWFLLLPTDYSLLSDHVIATLLFVSNFMYWREDGYFDVESHEKWLLHTWSLSVEWQFYLILPLALMAVYRLFPTRKALLIFFALAIVASIGLSVFLTAVRPVAAFYLLPTRVWELVAGGLVYLGAGKFNATTGPRRATEILGLVLIALAIVLFTPTTSWPGGWALVPVLGAVLVLGAGRSSIFTSSRPFQWVGTRSYSIYLWHWPTVVFLAYVGRSDELGYVAAGVIAAFVLGHISYHLVENPTRVWLQRGTPLGAAALLASSVAMVCFPAAAIRSLDGIETRLPHNVQVADRESRNQNPRIDECFVTGPTPVPQCKYGGAQLGAIVIGDSHAASIVRSMEKALPDESLHVLDWTLSSCPTLLGVKKLPNTLSPNCGDFVEWALRESGKLDPRAPLVILSRASWYAFGANEAGREDKPSPSIYFTDPFAKPTEQFLSQYRTRLVETACAFAKTRPVYLVRPIPEHRLDVPKTVARSLMLGSAVDVSIPVAEYHARHDFIWRAQDEARDRCGVTLLNPLPYLCDGERCSGTRDGRPLYYDDDHLSEYGAAELMPLWKQAVDNLE